MGYICHQCDRTMTNKHFQENTDHCIRQVKGVGIWVKGTTWEAEIANVKDDLQTAYQAIDALEKELDQQEHIAKKKLDAMQRELNRMGNALTTAKKEIERLKKPANKR